MASKEDVEAQMLRLSSILDAVVDNVTAGGEQANRADESHNSSCKLSRPSVIMETLRNMLEPEASESEEASHASQQLPQKSEQGSPPLSPAPPKTPPMRPKRRSFVRMAPTELRRVANGEIWQQSPRCPARSSQPEIDVPQCLVISTASCASTGQDSSAASTVPALVEGAQATSLNDKERVSRTINKERRSSLIWNPHLPGRSGVVERGRPRSVERGRPRSVERNRLGSVETDHCLSRSVEEGRFITARAFEIPAKRMSSMREGIRNDPFAEPPTPASASPSVRLAPQPADLLSPNTSLRSPRLMLKGHRSQHHSRSTSVEKPTRPRTTSAEKPQSHRPASVEKPTRHQAASIKKFTSAVCPTRPRSVEKPRATPLTTSVNRPARNVAVEKQHLPEQCLRRSGLYPWMCTADSEFDIPSWAALPSDPPTIVASHTVPAAAHMSSDERAECDSVLNRSQELIEWSAGLRETMGT